MIRIGVTGTDTGVGKTIVSCALAAALRRRGQRVVAMKPIETGVSPDDPDRDGARLARAAGHERDLAVTAPIALPDPVAPLVASRRARRPIGVVQLDQIVTDASRDADVLLIEGAGGVLVPVTDELAFDALFARWSLEPVVVAANRLGVINHVRLTLAALRAVGIAPRIVVLNELSSDATDTSMSDNAAIIAELEHVSVFDFPRVERVDDLERLADIAERSALVEALTHLKSH